jgi:hypothetical protein
LPPVLTCSLVRSVVDALSVCSRHGGCSHGRPSPSCCCPSAVRLFCGFPPFCRFSLVHDHILLVCFRLLLKPSWVAACLVVSDNPFHFSTVLTENENFRWSVLANLAKRLFVPAVCLVLTAPGLFSSVNKNCSLPHH